MGVAYCNEISKGAEEVVEFIPLSKNFHLPKLPLTVTIQRVANYMNKSSNIYANKYCTTGNSAERVTRNPALVEYFWRKLIARRNVRDSQRIVEEGTKLFSILLPLKPFVCNFHQRLCWGIKLINVIATNRAIKICGFPSTVRVGRGPLLV